MAKVLAAALLRLEQLDQHVFEAVKKSRQNCSPPA
jgi:hypothetical protein